MLGMDMLKGAMGFKPEMIEQGMQFIGTIAEHAKQMAAALNTMQLQMTAMREQLIRIEGNTQMIMEAASGTAPAAPTDYSVPMLSSLPPMDREPRASIPVGD